MERLEPLGGDFESLMGSYRLQAVVFRSLDGWRSAPGRVGLVQRLTRRDFDRRTPTSRMRSTTSKPPLEPRELPFATRSANRLTELQRLLTG
jgi:hypothetical protein